MSELFFIQIINEKTHLLMAALFEWVDMAKMEYDSELDGDWIWIDGIIEAGRERRSG